MSTTVLRGSSLGAVIRNYEDPRTDVYRRRTAPLHRHDDHSIYMRPDHNDTLEVLAECERHYTRLSRSDVRKGIAAPCPHRSNPCHTKWCP